MRVNLTLSVIALCCCFFMLPRLHAQAVAIAEIDGRITDPSGAAIASAKVTLTNTDTGQVHPTVTDSAGRYEFPNLPIGNYKLEVSSSGFKDYIQSGIVLEVGNNVQANVVLSVGSVSETIEVNANAAMVETRDNALSQVIDQQHVVDLPLNGRNPTQLITLTAAAVTAPGGDLTGSKNIQGSNGSGTFSVAGGQANGLNFLLDGGDNNDAFSNVNLPLPFPDALQEFSVETNALPAQFGLHPGGVVNAVTKSGSNAFHGDLFEFLRNGDFNARLFNATARDTLKRSQFGGVAGGRLIKDKLFFFGGYQGTRQRSNPPSSIAYVPTAADLQGNWSLQELSKAAGGCASGASIKLINPASVSAANPKGTPFAGNQIPVSQYDPAALKLANNYLPTPTNACGEVIFGIPANNPDDQWIGRIDYVRSAKHNLFGRYYLYDYTAETTFNGSNVLTTTSPGNMDRSQTATFGDTYSFSSTVLNSFHATFNRRRDDRGSAPDLISPSTLGIDINQRLPNYIDLVVGSVGSYGFGAGCGTCAQGYFNVNTYQLSDDFTLIRGAHQLGFGFDGRELQLNIANNQQVNGQFNFNGNITGDPLADFLLGKMNSYVQGNPNNDALREWVFAAYAQDSWRVRNNLTVNLGLRWEPAQPVYDAQNRGNQFLFPLFFAGVVSKLYPNAPPGLIFYNDPQNPYGPAFNKTHWLTSSPRVGIVWDPQGEGKQTIRTAFALMHDTNELFFPERWTTNPPYASSVTISNTLANQGGPFSNPWAGYAGGNPFPGAAIFPLGGTYVSIPPNMPPTYMMQWNFSYQRQLGKDWLATVNYVGNATRHIWGATDVNPSVYIPGSTASTNNRRLLYLASPAEGKYYSSIVQADPGGNASYHGLIFSVQHRFANHFTLLANYTWSHCISTVDFQGELAGTIYENPYNRNGERGSCIFDHRQNGVISLVANSFATGNAFTKILTQNWQLSPIFTAYTGAPININDGGRDISGTGQGQDRPNQVLQNAYPATQNIAEFFNPAAFALQQNGTFGNVGRNSLTGPGYWDLDLALSRTFNMTERFHLQVRGDAFNIFNHANWQLSGTTSFIGGTAGQITSFSAPRIIQLAAKFIF